VLLTCCVIVSYSTNAQVKEKLVVPMRMQWWRDAVNGLYKAKPIKHPAIQCLHQVRRRPETL